MITLCCPTRGRPKQMRRLYDSMLMTAHKYNNVELIFYIDDDDQESINEYNYLAQLPAHNAHSIIGPRIIIAEGWNECMKAGQGPIFMQCADDIVFESNNWDRLVIEKFDEYPDKIIMAYGRDGLRDGGLATHGFIHKNWINTVGYFTPPYFAYCMCDKWLDTVARAIDRLIYIPEICTAHWHCTSRKYTNGIADKTWIDMQQKGIREDYKGVYSKKREEREMHIEKLLKFIEGYKKQDLNEL